MEDLQDAVGQFVMYRDLLAEIEPEREAFVAVPDAVIDGILAEELGQILLRHGSLRVFGYDAERKAITRWV